MRTEWRSTHARTHCSPVVAHVKKNLTWARRSPRLHHVKHGELLRAGEAGEARWCAVHRCEHGPLYECEEYDAQTRAAVTAARVEAATAAAPCDYNMAEGKAAQRCSRKAVLQCICPRCASEPTLAEKFHACEDETHRSQIAAFHGRMRGRPVEWMRL